MINRDRYHIEVAGPVATIYILAHLPRNVVESLLGECDALPASVAKLRVNFGDRQLLAASDSEVTEKLRARWHSTRSGAFRVGSAEVANPRRSFAAGPDRVLLEFQRAL